jgi:hypothetical protein
LLFLLLHKHLLPRKKKRKLMPSLLLQHQHPQLLPQLRQQRLPKASLLRKSQLRKSQLKQTPKPLLQPQSNHGLDDNDDFIVDDEVTFGRNLKARDFGKVVHEDVELSDHVKFRLWLARQLALKKHQETWT